MIDLRAARADADGFRAALARKGAADVFDQLLDADREVRALQPRVEELRSRRKLKGKPTPEQLAELETVKAELAQLEAELAEREARRDGLLAQVPNPPHAAAPTGFADEDAAVLREVGTPRDAAVLGFPPRDHVDLAAPFGWIDAERAVRVSGSRFVYRIGDLALAELALYRFALDRLLRDGFTPVLPPILVREQAMYGTGFLPTDEVNIYRLERDDLYLTGTSEVGLAGLHMTETLAADALPLLYAGYSTNFRREAGAAGKDTRGMFRLHQFDKVEMFVYCLPEESDDWHARLLALEEALVQALELPYRVLDIAAGDLGAAYVRKFDIEAWFPGQGRYREITSTSNATDFQARRLDIRTRRDGRLEHVHTLNGTAVTARALLAVLENFQEADGSVTLPRALVEHGAPRHLGGAARP